VTENTSITRDGIVEALVAKRRLWPLIDHAPSCRFCAIPRQPQYVRDFPTCYRCGELANLYDGSLDDLYPMTYTTPHWALGTGIRELKDDLHARPDNFIARSIGAVLSAYLEAQLGGRRLGLPWDFGVVTTVPSSRPVVAAALRRAAQEGWWVPELTDAATVRPGHQRQRERPGAERIYVEDKWDVDRAAVDGRDVLVLDDIYTSGGSIHSFARALRQSGANSVRAVILARNIGADNGEWVLPLLRDRHDAGAVWRPTTNKYDVLRR
jgi:Phosphoribosyl transferase domain